MHVNADDEDDDGDDELDNDEENDDINERPGVMGSRRVRSVL